MAGDKVPFLVLAVAGHDVLADLHRLGAAGVEFAALGRVGGRRDIPREDDTVSTIRFILTSGLGLGTAENNACV